MNSTVHMMQEDIEAQETSFRGWIGIFDEETRISIWKNYQSFKRQIIAEGDAVVLYASSAILRLIEQIILNYNDIPEPPKKSAADEMIWFEAWLINNATFDLEVAENTKHEIDNLLGVLVVNQATQYESIGRKDFIYQTLLAHAFFKFLSDDLKHSPFLQEFLSRKQVATYGEYLRHILGVYAGPFEKRGNSFGFQIGEDEDSAKAIHFFDSIAYDLTESPFSQLSNSQTDPDYKIIRSKPLIKEENGQYYPLHYNFFVDKLYQGLVFDFYTNTSIQSLHKNFGQFLGYLGQEFAEQYLFNEYLPLCFFPKKYVLSVPGTQIIGIEYSDFYVREGNVLYLFEFKNSMVSAPIKHSKNFATIKAEIIKKLVYNPDNKKDKGIGQLINVIHKIEQGGFSFDDLSGKRVGRLQIYPVVVYTDDFFSLDGIQMILSEEFKNLLAVNPVKRHRVNDVTLIHLKDIIDIQFMVQKGIVSFKGIMETYFVKKKAIAKKRPRSNQEVLNKYIDFRSMMHNTIRPFADEEALRNRLMSALGLNQSA